MAAPAENEIEVLREFRKCISDIENAESFTDLYCLSWLRARDLNVTEANEMLRKSLAWRKEEEIEAVGEWEPPSHFLADYDYEIIGDDDCGRPVFLLPFGEWDVRKATTAGEAKALIRFVDQIFHKIFTRTRQSSQKRNQEITQFVMINDMANFSIRQLTSIATILQFASRFEANFPETLHSAYVVNASRAFTMLFAIVKPLLSARTLSKISMGHIPHVDKGATERLNYITVEVEAGKKFELEFTVTQPQSRITWTFETEKYDIGFSINFNREEEVLPFRRSDSHMNEESGDFICEKPGEYFLIFDNTYSKMRGKVVHYMADLIEAVKEDEDE